MELWQDKQGMVKAGLLSLCPEAIFSWWIHETSSRLAKMQSGISYSESVLHGWLIVTWVVKIRMIITVSNTLASKIQRQKCSYGAVSI